MQPDRYRYSYDGRPPIGPVDSPVLLECATSGDVPIPSSVPVVVHRVGVDLNPLDVRDPATVAWLSALIWPGSPERDERLRGTIEIARQDPPKVLVGDLNDLV